LSKRWFLILLRFKDSVHSLKPEARMISNELMYLLCKLIIIHLNSVRPKNSYRSRRCDNFHHISKPFNCQTAPATFIKSRSQYHCRLQISSPIVSSVYTDQNRKVDITFSFLATVHDQLSQGDTLTVAPASHSRTSSTFQLRSVTVADSRDPAELRVGDN